MKMKIFALVVVFSAIGIAFSSYLQKAESAVFIDRDLKCAIPPFRQAFQASKTVFVGEVTGEEKSGNLRTFDFKVEKYWKGAGEKNVEINVYETSRFQAWFKKGEKYLIYATTDENGNLRVGRCSRSRDLDQAAEDLQKLGRGKQPR